MSIYFTVDLSDDARDITLHTSIRSAKNDSSYGVGVQICDRLFKKNVQKLEEGKIYKMVSIRLKEVK